MSIRKSILSISLLGAFLAPAAFATSGTTAASGEQGFTSHALPSAKTREQVQKELAEWRKNPVTADGYREVGGEIGAVPEGHKYLFRDGKLVHADNIPHDSPKPSLLRTGSEGRHLIN